MAAIRSALPDAIQSTLFACCAAVVDLPQSAGPSIKTAPMV